MECARELLNVTSQSYCPRCGTAAGEYLFDRTGCSECRGQRSWPDGFVRVGTYHDLVGRTLRRFKFKREHRLDACLGGLLADAITGCEWGSRIDALVPVPADWWGRLRYRCRPVRLLSARVSRKLGVPVMGVIELKGKRRRQVGLPESQRARNVRGVFRVKRSASLADLSLCVIDDVSTTGSTVQEVTRVLRAAGARAVYAAVLAKTDARRGDHEPL
jgi:ComF family protein